MAHRWVTPTPPDEEDEGVQTLLGNQDGAEHELEMFEEQEPELAHEGEEESATQQSTGGEHASAAPSAPIDIVHNDAAANNANNRHRVFRTGIITTTTTSTNNLPSDRDHLRGLEPSLHRLTGVPQFRDRASTAGAAELWLEYQRSVLPERTRAVTLPSEDTSEAVARSPFVPLPTFDFNKRVNNMDKHENKENIEPTAESAEDTTGKPEDTDNFEDPDDVFARENVRRLNERAERQPRALRSRDDGFFIRDVESGDVFLFDEERNELLDEHLTIERFDEALGQDFDFEAPVQQDHPYANYELIGGEGRHRHSGNERVHPTELRTLNGRALRVLLPRADNPNLYEWGMDEMVDDDEEGYDEPETDDEELEDEEEETEQEDAEIEQIFRQPKRYVIELVDAPPIRRHLPALPNNAVQALRAMNTNTTNMSKEEFLETLERVRELINQLPMVQENKEAPYWESFDDAEYP